MPDFDEQVEQNRSSDEATFGEPEPPMIASSFTDDQPSERMEDTVPRSSAEEGSTAPDNLFPPVGDLLLAAVQGLSADLRQLQAAFDSKLKYDESKQKMVDTLHLELQMHREGLHFRIIRPLLLDLIDVHNDLDNLLKHSEPQVNAPESEARLQRNLASFQNTIEEILYRNGVEMYSETGDQLVAQRQRVIKTIATDVAEQHGRVAEKVRKGFVYEGRVLRPETVVTYKFVEQ